MAAMKTEELYRLLVNSDSLSPHDLTQNKYTELASELDEIFSTYQDELKENEKFRNNFTELVNYIYLDLLNESPSKRNKEIFNSNLTNFVLSYRAA